MHYLGRLAGVAALALSTTALSGCYMPPPPPPAAAVAPDQTLPPPPVIGMAAPYRTPAYPEPAYPPVANAAPTPLTPANPTYATPAIRIDGTGRRSAEQRWDDHGHRRTYRPAASAGRDTAPGAVALGDVAARPLELGRGAIFLGLRPLRRAAVAVRQLNPGLLAAGPGRLDLDERLLELTELIFPG